MKSLRVTDKILEKLIKESNQRKKLRNNVKIEGDQDMPIKAKDTLKGTEGSSKKNKPKNSQGSKAISNLDQILNKNKEQREVEERIFNERLSRKKRDHDQSSHNRSFSMKSVKSVDREQSRSKCKDLIERDEKKLESAKKKREAAERLRKQMVIDAKKVERENVSKSRKRVAEEKREAAVKLKQEKEQLKEKIQEQKQETAESNRNQKLLVSVE